MMPENNSMHQIETAAKEWLEKRGVKISEIADLVYVLQKKYHPNLTKEECEENVNRVMKKREVQNAVITGIQLDMLGEQRKLMEPLLYGVDEILSFSIVNLYGSIGYTNYGYIDKIKPGVLARLNDKSTGECHTFLDDIVGAIAAAASSRLAHRAKDAE